MFSVLDKKLIRDVRKLWTQILAISLVLACGVSTIIIGVGAYRSLKETQGALYERYLFASHFAQIVRAPKHVANQIALLDNVIAVEPRIVKPAILDLAGMKEPASGLVTSLPENRQLSVNRVYLREGRLPRSNAIAEVAVLDRFARAHEFRPGDRFDLIMNGKKNTVTIVGIVLSPEFIYVIGPGDMVPDDKRFAVLFFSEAVLASIYDMQGAFNNIGIRASSSADSSALIRALDQILRPYGSTGAHDRADQVSHAFLQSELNQLEAMARIIPPIFLFVAAFLVNMILNRLITLEREQIGLFKAMGYSNLQVGWHYAKLVMFIAAVGILIGSLFGFWAGRGLTRLYGDIFTFPFLLFHSSLDLYVIAGGDLGCRRTGRCCQIHLGDHDASPRRRHATAGTHLVPRHWPCRFATAEDPVTPDHYGVAPSSALAGSNRFDDSGYSLVRGVADHLPLFLRFAGCDDQQHLF